MQRHALDETLAREVGQRLDPARRIGGRGHQLRPPHDVGDRLHVDWVNREEQTCYEAGQWTGELAGEQRQ